MNISPITIITQTLRSITALYLIVFFIVSFFFQGTGQIIELLRLPETFFLVLYTIWFTLHSAYQQSVFSTLALHFVRTHTLPSIREIVAPRGFLTILTFNILFSLFTIGITLTGGAFITILSKKYHAYSALSPTMLTIIMPSLFVLCLIIALVFIYLLLRYSFTFFCAVDGARGPLESLSCSWQLTRNNLKAIRALLLITLFLGIICLLLIYSYVSKTNSHILTKSHPAIFCMSTLIGALFFNAAALIYITASKNKHQEELKINTLN